MKGKLTRWFIEGDAFTNEALAVELAKRGEGTAENQMILKDNKGKEHNVWEVKFEFVSFLQKNKKAFPFKFKVFRIVNKGPLQEWDLYKRRNPSRKTVRAMQDLKEILEKKAKGAGTC
ncbi:MAG: hypothetical protein WC238_01525 [Parcubacteria group bacterium]